MRIRCPNERTVNTQVIKRVILDEIRHRTAIDIFCQKLCPARLHRHERGEHGARLLSVLVAPPRQRVVLDSLEQMRKLKSTPKICEVVPDFFLNSYPLRRIAALPSAALPSPSPWTSLPP